MHTRTMPTLRSQLANDPEMRELLELFLSELPKRANAVMHAWQSGELNTLRRVAHQLKGSCAGYGFPTIGSVAGDLENTITVNGPLERIAEDVRELVALCERATGTAASKAA
jgi:HPt (histidine-containing phosphotransfer) domain-containing protein